MDAVPRAKRAKACSDDAEDDGAATTPTTAAKQIAELQAELERRKIEHDNAVRDLSRRHEQVVRDLKGEKIAMEECHDQVVRELKGKCSDLKAGHSGLKGSYSDALNWAYSETTVQRDHWLEKGHTDEYADAMGSLLNTFKHIIKDLRTGTVGESIEVRFDLQDDDGRSVTTDHDEVLMPYWRELANALIHWSEYHAGEEALHVIICCVETPNAVLDVLSLAMKRSKVRAFGIVSDGHSRPCKLDEFIVDMIHSNHEVTTVGFHSVVLSNEEWKTICDAIRARDVGKTSTMELSQFHECFVDGISDEALKDILTSNAVWVSLGGNGMSSREASIIAEFLNSNPPLARLSLKNSQ